MIERQGCNIYKCQLVCVEYNSAVGLLPVSLIFAERFTHLLQGVRENLPTNANQRMPMDVVTQAEDGTVELLRHLAFERIAPQWAGFLGVLGTALQSQLSPEEFRHFLKRLGAEFAKELPLPAVDDLSALEHSINRIWFDRQWGMVVFSDLGGALRLEHKGCPLPAALQADADLAGGFLEGAYGAWLAAAGAPNELALAQQPASGLPMHMAFELRAS